ncbi:MAG TPA: hypothetical protein VFE03_11795 [Caulobacteraceae bacterium]|jgi:hypothetical protein|nr:hypothetical protein [Caulobacteraceae bacterium]
MSKKAPPIPPEQRSFRGQKPDIADDTIRRDPNIDVEHQGRQANIRQNLTPQRHVQER